MSARQSLARGLRSLIDSPNAGSSSEQSSYQNLLSPKSSAAASTSRPTSPRPSTPRQSSDDSTWDMVDDLPLRWATDFVPLAAAGSRLLNASVHSYALWNHDDLIPGRGGRLLAIITKSNILLYETPKGERAFRFAKVIGFHWTMKSSRS
jgi:hypothetical protein